MLCSIGEVLEGHLVLHHPLHPLIGLKREIVAANRGRRCRFPIALASALIPSECCIGFRQRSRKLQLRIIQGRLGREIGQLMRRRRRGAKGHDIVRPCCGRGRPPRPLGLRRWTATALHYGLLSAAKLRCCCLRGARTRSLFSGACAGISRVRPWQCGQIGLCQENRYDLSSAQSLQQRWQDETPQPSFGQLLDLAVRKESPLSA
mmetsp:Transcript_123890/g.264072  ORF Transcript_123890/g.264072 Transcript_123890/m.264072 type:complete len:205 (-) Transcript_123890:819-1433(-)